MSGWDAAIKAIGTGLSAWLGFRGQNKQAQSVADTNRQNRELQEQAWSREDTAVQRRMADLKAAGLNPALAAGGAASSGPSISFQPTGDGGFSALSKGAAELGNLPEYQQALKSARLGNEAQKLQNEDLARQNDFNEWNRTMTKIERPMVTGLARNKYLQSQKALSIMDLELEQIAQRNTLLRQDDRIKNELIKKMEWANEHNNVYLMIDIAKALGSVIGGVGKFF